MICERNVEYKSFTIIFYLLKIGSNFSDGNEQGKSKEILHELF